VVCCGKAVVWRVLFFLVPWQQDANALSLDASLASRLKAAHDHDCVAHMDVGKAWFLSTGDAVASLVTGENGDLSPLDGGQGEGSFHGGDGCDLSPDSAARQRFGARDQYQTRDLLPQFSGLAQSDDPVPGTDAAQGWQGALG